MQLRKKAKGFERAGKTSFWIMAPGFLYLLSFFIIPIIFLIRYSFYTYVPGQVMIKNFTLENYISFFGDPYFREIFGSSFVMAIVICLLTIVLAYPLAYFLARVPSKWNALVSGAVYLPLLASTVVTAFGWMTILSDNGVLNNLLLSLGLIEEPLRIMYTKAGVYIALTQSQLPFMVTSIRNVLYSIDRFTEESSQTLGARPVQTFFYITLPLSLPGIASGTLLVFVGVLSAFVTPELIGGGRVNTLASVILRQTQVQLNWPLAAAISLVLLVVASSALFLYNKAMESNLLGGGGRN